MQHKWKIAIMSLLWFTNEAYSDEITITRVGTTDWVCADADSVKLSGHQRVDKAIQACANRSLADGKTYRVIPTEYIVVAALSDTPPDDPQLGSVTLSWDAPTQNEDGTQLTDLAGYTIYYDLDSADGYSNNVSVYNVTTFVLDDLSPDCYKFVVTAFNESGVESVYSNHALKCVN